MATPSPSPSGISRRRFVAATGGGLAAALVFRDPATPNPPLYGQTINLGGEPGATPEPPLVPAPAPAEPETVTDVAAWLGFDPERIVAFVRDEIAYEAYSGVLRGAQGALSARAGNSADQAVLLGALLEAAQVPHRFAAGPLDAAFESHLLGALSRTPESARAAYDRAMGAAARHALGLAPDDPLPETLDTAAQQMLDDYRTSAETVIDLARASADISVNAITEALADAGIALPPPPDLALPASERHMHTWIQVADGATWQDLDPLGPEGATSPAPTLTTDVPPDDWYHWITVSVEGDVWTAGATSRKRVVSLGGTSDNLASIPMAVSLATADALTGTGFAIAQIADGRLGFLPWIYAGGNGEIATEPLLVTTDAGAALGALGVATGGVVDGETVAVWLVIEMTSPGAEPVRIERALLDRVPPEQRLGGVLDPSGFAPLAFVEGAQGPTLEELERITLIMTEVARTPSLVTMQRYATDQVLGPVAFAGPSLGDLRTALGGMEEEPNGTWSYPSVPNLTALQIGATAEGSPSILLDLLHRERTVLPLAGAEREAAAHPLVRSGVLDAAAEHALVAPGLPEDQGVVAGPSIGVIFAAAAELGAPVRALTSADDLAGLSLDPASERMVSEALASGLAVVIPEGPVTLEGGAFLGWWTVDLATGAVRDRLQDGTAGASIILRGGASAGRRSAPMGEYARLTQNLEMVLRSKAMCFLGAMMAHVAFRAVVLLALSSSASGAAGIAAASAVGGTGAGAAIASC